MSYVIEKNVPMPQNARSGLLATLRLMEVGDSIMVFNKISSQVSNNLSTLRPKKFVVRTQDGGVRVWRVA